MKISLSQEFLNADDTPSVPPLTLKDILIGSLLDHRAPDGEKVKRYSLYRDIKKSKVGFVIWDAEDVAFLKKVVLETQGTLVVGQAHEMLETQYVEQVEAA